MKVEFNVKYGKNVIEIPMPEQSQQRPTFDKVGMTDLWASKVTIYNDIMIDDERIFDRSVINKCNVQSGRVTKADGTVENIVNARTVITRDVEKYLPPDKYIALTADEKADKYTVKTGAFVIVGEVSDVVENSQQFAALQKKYDENGFKVTTVSPCINGMAVDNISITNA